MTRQVRPIARAVSLVLAVYTAVRITAYFLDLFSTKRHHVEAAWLWLTAALFVYAMALVLRPAETDRRSATLPHGVWYLLVAAVAAAWVVYLPSLRVGLLSDDFVLLARAGQGSFSSHNEFFRPLPLLLWRAAAWATSAPWLLHAMNITLHGVASGLVGVLALRSGFSGRWALFAALTAALQPISVEPVTWISGMQDVLMTACVLGGIAIGTSDSRFQLAGLMFVGAALLSKETAVAAPFLLLALCAGAGVRRTTWMYLGLVSVCVGGYLVLRSFVLRIPTEYLATPSAYLVKELLVRPFAGLAVPWHQHAIADWPWVAIAPALFPLVLVVIMIARDRGDAAAFRFVAWIVLAVAPVYTYFFITPDLEGSRYLYLAVPGWALLIADLTRAAFNDNTRGWPAAVVCTSILLFWGGGVMVNLRPWIAAAHLRDKVLDDAARAVAANGCRASRFEALPDSVDGAYVFRNGFAEATRSLPSFPAGPDCRLRWTGATFVSD